MDYIERVTGMTTNMLLAVSQDHNSSDEMVTKQFLITFNIIRSSNNHSLME